MGVVGRDAHLAEIHATTTGAARGSGRLLLVEGAPGMGRTLLADRAVEDARSRGLQTVHVRTGPRDRDVPFAVVRQLAAGLDLQLSDPGPRARVPDPAEVEDVAARLLEAATARAPGACVVVDDVHWADPPSLTVLLRLGRRAPARGGVALVLTSAPDPRPDQAARLLDELRSLPGVTAVHLEPLTDADAATLVRVTLGADAEEDAVRACVRRAAGNPFLLTELASEAARARAGTIGEVVPRRVRAAVATRMGRAGAAATAVARAISVLGAEATPARAAALADVDRREAEDALDTLVRGALLRARPFPAFVEPLVEEAVAAAIEPFARERLHRRAAELLAGEGASAVEVARHLLRTSPARDGRAVEHLLRAAEVFTASGDLRACADVLARALDEPAPTERRPQLLADLAFAESRSGSPRAHERIAAALAQAPDRTARLRLLREQARVLWLTSRLPEAIDHSEQAVRVADPASPEHGRALAELLAITTMHDVAAVRERPALADLLQRARAGWVPDSPPLAATLAVALPMTGGDHRRIPALLERATSEDLWRPEAEPFGLRPDFVIGALDFADDLDRSLATIEEGLAIAEAAGDMVRIGLLCHWEAVIAQGAGQPRRAISAAERSMDGSAGDFTSWLGYTTAALVHARLDVGERDAAGDALGYAHGRVPPELVAGAAVDHARARVLAETGRAQQALELVLDAGDRLRALSQAATPVVVWRPLAVELAVATDRDDLARELAAEEVEIARRTHWPSRLGTALRAAASVPGATGDRLALLGEALEVLAGAPRRLELARVLLDLGRAQHETGDVARAREALGEAREIAEHSGAAPLANKALRSLHATGARPRRTARTGPDALTSAEQRVVERALEGLTNREIAAELHLAPRTVEWHLGRAFAKLGVHSRRDLPRALARER